MKPILIAKMGQTLPTIREGRGDFEVWIQRGMQRPAGDFTVVEVPDGGVLPSPGAFSAVVLTGSASMVSEREDWSERAARWLLGAFEADVPILGICYGHQLIAHALGGRVGPNPNGREIGSVHARLEARGDVLLGVLPAESAVHTSHSEAVLELPPGAEKLAETDLDRNHAFRVGPRVWGVQFHPEFDADIMRGYIEVRRPQLEEEGLLPDRLLAACRESPHGAQLLARFSELVQRWASPG